MVAVMVPGRASAALVAQPPVPVADAADLLDKQLPVNFEKNQGQADEEVLFLHRSPSATLFLTRQSAVLSVVHQNKHAAQSPGFAGLSELLPNSALSETGLIGRALEHALGSGAPEGHAGPAPVTGAVVRLNFLGANPDVSVVGTDKRVGKTNYLTGKDHAGWVTGVANFGAVSYQGVYEDIDLVFHGGDGALEYDFVVGPGAHPDTVRLGLEGVEKLSVAAGGDLVLHLADGSQIRQSAPISFQSIDGKRVPVPSRFELFGDNTFGFEVGDYDRSKPLVIDPKIAYSGFIGGGDVDRAHAVGLDGIGSIYMGGITYSSRFPTTVGAFQAGGEIAYADGFITKLTPDGREMLFSTIIGGALTDAVEDVAVDGRGDVFLAGSTLSNDFPATDGAFQEEKQPAREFDGTMGFDGFVTKLHRSGAELVYSSFLGGTGDDGTVGLAVDAGGEAWVTGLTASGGSFPTTDGAYQEYAEGRSDAFTTKVAADGSRIVYSSFLGGDGDEYGIDVILAPDNGDPIIAGGTNSLEFPTVGGPPRANQSYRGIDTFITRIASGDGTPRYSTTVGGSSTDLNFDVAVDPLGGVYVSGFTFSGDFVTTPGAFQPSIAGSMDAFVTKLRADGSEWEYSSYLGGVGNCGSGFESEFATSISVDAKGSAVVSGTTCNTPDFPTTPDAFQPEQPDPDVHLSPTGGNDTSESSSFDGFVTKVNGDGTAMVYSSYLGGRSSDLPMDSAFDGEGSLYLVGTSASCDFPVAGGALSPKMSGAYYADGFLTKVVDGDPGQLTQGSCVRPTAIGAGSLDDTFGTGGVVTTDVAGADAIQAMERQTDGKLVVAGNSDNHFALGRYGHDGQLDPSFGTRGVVVTDPETCDVQSPVSLERPVPVGECLVDATDELLTGNEQSAGLGPDGATAMVIRPDGRIVVAGENDYDWVLRSYLSDGSVDQSFGSRSRLLGSYGETVTDFATAYDAPHAMALQPDGKIVVVGTAATHADADITPSMGSGTATDDIAMARYLVTGELDPTFGTGGKVITPLGGEEQARAVHLYPDGKILVAADPHVVRYMANGTLDPSFGQGGIVTLRGIWASAIGVQPSGRILAAGTGYNGDNSDFEVHGLLGDGALDPTFGDNGVVATDIDEGRDNASDLVIAEDGSFFVAGTTVPIHVQKGAIALAHYHEDGAIDRHFAIGGVAVTDITPWIDGGSSLVLQPDGKPVVAGFADVRRCVPESCVPQTTGEFALVRYNVSGERPSRLAFTDASATTGQYSDSAVTEVYVEDHFDNPIASAEVSLELVGADGSQVTSANTDATGKARYTTPLSKPAGTYTLTARYAGLADRYTGTSVSTSFVITKEDTSMNLAVVGAAAKRALQAKLTDPDSPGSGISSRLVQFHADGTFIGTATTGADGVATLLLPSRYLYGNHTYESRFDGDGFYLPAATTVTWTQAR